MDIKLDQKKLEAAIVQQAVDDILSGDHAVHEMVRSEINKRITAELNKNLNKGIEKTLNGILEAALDSEVNPVNIWGEREGEPTTIRAALHKRAQGWWQEKVNSKGEKETYGGKPRHEYVLSMIAAKEFDSAIKQNMVNMAGALKDAVRKDFYNQVDEHLNKFFKVKSLVEKDRVKGKK